MRQYHFVVHLSKDECLQYYQGYFRELVVRATTGERIQISARHFHRFIQRDGIHGHFSLTLDAAGKLVRLVKNS